MSFYLTFVWENILWFFVLALLLFIYSKISNKGDD